MVELAIGAREVHTVNTGIVYDDTRPWFVDLAPENEALHPAFNELITANFPRRLSSADIERYIDHLSEEVLKSGDCCVVPLMSAAAIFQRLRNERPDVLVLPAPLSRHPFWCLMPPLPELGEWLRRYADLSRVFMKLLNRVVREGRIRRFVFFDSNSATGRDFTMLNGFVSDISNRALSGLFLVLCNETTAESVDHGPGLRGGLKSSTPDHWAIRVVDHNVKYLSHLYALLRYDEVERESLASQLIAAHPEIFVFWNDPALRAHSPHNYGALGGPTERKARVTFAAAESAMAWNRAHETELLAWRNRFELNGKFANEALTEDPESHWSKAIHDFRP